MSNKTFFTSLLVAGGFVFSAHPLNAMTLTEYLKEVENSSLVYKGAKAQSEASQLVSREADLITTPKFFANLRTSYDNKVGTPPMKIYDEMQTQTIGVGISQTFDFGLDLKFSYNFSKYNLEGYSPASDGKYWDASPSVEFTMPLWAGGFGALVKAQKEVTKKQNEADALQNTSLSIQTIIEAENTYYSLALARERVKNNEKSLLAGRNIYSYVNNQKSKNLGEAADVLQARALVESYDLQLLQAKNEVERLERMFNKYLNRDSATEVPSLEDVNYQSLKALSISKERPGDRFDVLAQKAQLDLARASSTLVLERNKPQLNLAGGYTIQGRDQKFGEAHSNAFENDKNAGYVALQFSMPLNFQALSDVRAGASRLKDAADIREANVNYSQDMDWIDLREKLLEAQSSLDLTLKMEAAQKAKLENERIRLRQGRTTTYQVLLFEQDYSNAQSQTLQVANQIIALKSQANLYIGAPQGDK